MGEALGFYKLVCRVRGLTGIWGFTILSSYNEGYMKGGRERGRGRNISIIFITYKIPFDPTA